MLFYTKENSSSQKNYWPCQKATSMECVLILVGVLWGVTNPFLKRGTRGLTAVKAKSKFGQLKGELGVLANWKYLCPWLVNQCGSVLYVGAVRQARLSLAAPLANALAFAVTAVTGHWLGERPLGSGPLLGILLIVAGTSLCYLDSN
ncbi:Transmembrane protein 234 homolog [Eumeta japonica]|uniref:Transmembrane protein 234 homolog n=1 Tax=Eumeta variegata TaxID=151549 RepID=A0A4C1X2F8_EUMVA|nr:Transmembrane protein 234 homolog [Eumeta japonica]